MTTIMPRTLLVVAVALISLASSIPGVQAFLPQVLFDHHQSRSRHLTTAEAAQPQLQPCWALDATTGTGKQGTRICRARDLVQGLIEEEQCFSSVTGARAFGDVCAYNIVYEDRFEAQPIVGKTVRGIIPVQAPASVVAFAIAYSLL